MKNLATTQKKSKLASALFQYVVQQGLAAPSGDNCQPFLFKNTDSGVVILHDNTRGLHTLNANGIGSSVALGCTIESIAIAMSHRGYETDCRIFDRYDCGAAKVQPVAEIYFSGSHVAPDQLFYGLSQRYTDRSLYLGGTIDGPMLEQLLSMRPAKISTDYSVKFCSQPSQEFVKAVSWLDRAVWVHRTAHQDLMKWLRLNDAAIATTDDGMPWTTLGAKPHELIALRLNRHWRFQQCANVLGAPMLMEQLNKKLIRSSAGLFLLSTKDPTFASEVAIGRTAFRIWVWLNTKGFGVQPMSLAPFMAYLSCLGKKPDFKQSYLERIERLPAIFRQEFDLDKNETPIWMFRTGKTRPIVNPDERSRTKRRDWNKAVIH